MRLSARPLIALGVTAAAAALVAVVATRAMVAAALIGPIVAGRLEIS